jgi:transcriptional regulator with XRE-family HTH domain
MNRLRELREARGWSQSGLALAARVSRTSVGKYERGTAHPRPETLKSLAAALGVEVSDLVARGEP